MKSTNEHRKGQFTYNPNDSKKRIFDRRLLPIPAIYYTNEFRNSKFKPKGEWLTVPCCFHKDENPSLRINIAKGHFICFSCSTKGGDVISFHMLRYNMKFVDVVTHFGAWRYE